MEGYLSAIPLGKGAGGDTASRIRTFGADPGHQVTPGAWSALDIGALEVTVGAYTSRVLDTLRAHGALLRIVAVGNELGASLLWLLGRIGSPGHDDATAYARFGRLLRAGTRGVRNATTADDSVRVRIHYSGGANTAGTQWFYNLVADRIAVQSRRDGRRDVLSMARRMGPVRAIPGTMSWPATAEGQRLFVRDLLVTVASVPNQRGAGVHRWYPEAVEVARLDVWGGGTLAMFDAAGSVLPAAGALKNP